MRFLWFISILIVCGCAVTPQYNQAPIAITVEQLDQYWVNSPEQFSFRNSLPAPSTRGEVTLRFLIDSQGMPFYPQVIASEPAGLWDLFALRAVEELHYEPADTNASRVPVYVETTFTFEG